MTVLIGASVLLIAGSAIALVFGWTGADQSLIWTSIAATAAAAVTLSLAYVRSRSEAATAGRSVPPSGTSSAAATVPSAATRAEPAEKESASQPEKAAQVVAVASTKKFHLPSCRYASAAGGQTLSAAEARAQGFSPCGVCKP